jgi:hypothetical protein
MHRLQVQLTAAQERALREMARLRGCSISALIREGVDHLLEPSLLSRAEAIERASAVIGSFSSGLSDVSTRHDHYLAEAYAGLKEDGDT